MYKFLPVLIILSIIALAIYFLNQKKPMEQPTQISPQQIEVSNSEDFKGLGYSGQNKIVADSKGQIFVTYRKKVNDQYSVFVSTLELKNGLLRTKRTVNVSGGDDLPSQRVGSLAVDSQDNIHLAWYGEIAEENKGRQIKYSRSEDGGETWSEPVVVSFVEGFNDEDLWQEHPSIAVSKDGLIYILWEGRDATHQSQQIKLSKSEDGKTWTQWRNILPGLPSQSRPNVLIDSQDNLYVIAYSRNGLQNQQIWITQSGDGGETWSDLQKVSQLDSDSRHVDAVIDDSDNIHIAWRQESENKKTQIYYSQYADGKLSPPTQIASKDAYQFFPQIGMGSDQQVYIGWIETGKKSSYPEDDPETGDIYIASKPKNSTQFTNKLVEKAALYPNLLLGSSIPDATVVLFSKIENDLYPVKADIVKIP